MNCLNRTICCLLLISALIFLLPGCKIYSFTGANISPDIKTFFVDNFPNVSGNGPADLSLLFTDRLKQKMLQEANLRQVNQNADLVFTGSIRSYAITFENPIQGATTALNKLTISLEVQFTNNHSNEQWTQNFSRFAQYPSSEEVNAVESRLIREINEQLCDDIFQKALVKW